jgi:hypothetical protein
MLINKSSVLLGYNSLYNVFDPDNWPEKSPPWAADSCSADEEILRFLWNLKVHYKFHKILSLDPILGFILILSALLY